MKRALLVIDVQNEYFTGALPISHPGKHFEKILQVMDHANSQAIPTVVVRHHQPTPDSPIFCKGTHAWELHEEIKSRPRSLLLDKSLPGSFTKTELDQWLRSNEIDTVTISGYMTHMCCDTTAREAMHRGYHVEFLSDATGTLDIENNAGKVSAEELQRAILCSQQMLISEVIDTQAWLRRC
jgi:nicotinamidase-related amidase